MSVEFQSNENNNGIVTLEVKGEIDMNSSSEVREKLTPYFENNKKAVIVDLAGVSYIDSSGIATLVEGLQWSHTSNNRFRLTGLSSSVKDIFEIAHLLNVFEIFDSIEDALIGIA